MQILKMMYVVFEDRGMIKSSKTIKWILFIHFNYLFLFKN